MAASKRTAAKAAKKAGKTAAKKSAPRLRGLAFAPPVEGAASTEGLTSGAQDVVRSTLPIADEAGQAPAETTTPVAEPEAEPPPPMPLFKSHKTVRAAKIEGVRNDWAEQGVHVEGLGLVRMGDEWMAKHKPEAGGYLVEYEDGYRSFSPAKAFEDGYTAIKG